MKIPYGRQDINKMDIDSVVSVLQSDFITQGPVGPQFENIISNYVSSRHCYAVNSATSGLHLSCLALGVKRGDSVWTSPISFVASANCARYCGADVDFVDIDPLSYNMSVQALENKLLLAERAGKLPKVLIVVHLAGQSCDMLPISELAKKYNFKIIEDASHAIGGSYKGEKIGSCQFSDITVFSFHPVKIITTGEGGVICTDNPELASRINRLRSHGITREIGEMTHAPDGPWYYQQLELGYNYRMTDIQAALGVSQMKRLDYFIERRHLIYNKYAELLVDSGLQLPSFETESVSSLHLYIVRVSQKISGLDRNDIFNLLRSKGVFVNLHYIPIYRHPYYQKFGYDLQDFPESENYYREAISLPMYPGLTLTQIEKISDIILGT